MSSESLNAPNEPLLRASLRAIAIIGGSSFLFVGLLATGLYAANVTGSPGARDNVTSTTSESPDKAKAPSSPKTETKQKS